MKLLKNIKVLLFVTISFGMSTIAVFGQGFLKTQGKFIVNDNGPILLKGLNLGNWLVNEGYLMEMHPAADAPWEIREKLVEMIGEENTDDFFTIYRASYIQERDIDTIFKLGFNHVRLPFHYNILTPENQPGVYLDEGFAYLDSTIAWCKKRGMYVVLDMHCVPGAANSAGHGDSKGSNDFWNIDSNQTRFYEVWKELARRYKDEPWVAGYDLVNESVNVPDQPGNTLMRKVFEEATRQIRTIDKTHIIFVEGNWYASDFRGLTPPWDDNMVYSFHKYWVPNTVDHMQYLFDIQEEFNIPLWLGEAGENGNNWYGNHVKLLEDHDIGWCWWTYKKPNSITAPFVLNFTPGWLQLKKYYKGGIEKPNVEYLKSALLKFAASTTLDYCSFNPDVYDALMRKDFLTKSKQWPINPCTAPCVIPANDFDTGANGVAYYDNVFETNSLSPFTTWNNNWVGRNDGVDMYRIIDSTEIEYVVTDFQTNEWINYTFKVDEGGSYTFLLNYAAASMGCSISLYLDDVLIQKKFELPASGGKWDWKDIKIVSKEITTGEHRLKIKAQNGGFNLKEIKIQK